MRILFYLENHVYGGGSKHCIDLINATLTITKDVVLLMNIEALTDQEKQKWKTVLKIDYVNTINRAIFCKKWLGNSSLKAIIRKIAFFLSPFILLANIIFLFMKLSLWKPDIIVSCNGGYPGAESCLAMIFAARLKNIPSILSVVSLPRHRRSVLFPYDQLIDYLIDKSVSMIISNSPSQVQALSNRRGFRSCKLCHIFNGIADVETKKIVKSGQVNFEKKPIMLGVVSRLDEKKGLNYLIDAIALLKQKHDIRLQIIGEGSEYGNLVKQTQSLGLTDTIEFSGFVSGDLQNHFNSFDIFVFPSLWEGLPYSLIEAMKYGLPIVSTDVGGIPDAIKHSQEGVLVKPGSALSLAEGISLVLSDPELAKRLSRNARQRFESQFILSKMESDFQEVLKKVSSTI